MANIYFYYRSKKSEKGNLTIRLKHSNIDCRTSSNIVSNRNYWVRSNGTPRALKDLSDLKDTDAKIHRKYLKKIEENILSQFQTDNNNGVLITAKWLKETLADVTGIINDAEKIKEEQQKINDAEEIEENIKEIIRKKNLVTSSIENVINIEYFDNPTQKKMYNQALNKIKDYQVSIGKEIYTEEVNQYFVDLFTSYLIENLKHKHSTSKKHCKSVVHSIKYQKRAFSNDVKVSEDLRDLKYKKLSTSKKRDARKEIVITLSFDELEQIENTEVPARLLDAKKNILFGCETGLRVSDYKKLIDANIVSRGDNMFWEFYSQKTGSNITIPVSSTIKRYIKKFGMPKTDYTGKYDVIINRQVKEVCKIAEINTKVKGRKSQVIIVNKDEVRRTISAEYYKHELITSHCFRRSLATNYFNARVSLKKIMSITGHQTKSQLIEYINQTEDTIEEKTDLFNELEQVHKDRKKETDLKVVSINKKIV